MELSLHVNGESCSEFVINTLHYFLRDGRGQRRFGLRFFTVSGPGRPPTSLPPTSFWRLPLTKAMLRLCVLVATFLYPSEIAWRKRNHMCTVKAGAFELCCRLAIRRNRFNTLSGSALKKTCCSGKSLFLWIKLPLHAGPLSRGRSRCRSWSWHSGLES